MTFTSLGNFHKRRHTIRERSVLTFVMLGIKLCKIIPTRIFLFRTYDKISDKKLNGTFTKEAAAESESYDMTPSRDELPPQPSKDEENYGIEDLHSDEVIFFYVMASGVFFCLHQG